MRLVFLRHGESIGNVDESAFCRTPDHTMDLTPTGREQSRAAGERLRALLGSAPIDVYVSPYRRTWQTLEELDLGTRVRRVREEPRLREQDWGNLQDPATQAKHHRERDVFGHFFYRLSSGESGADVYDRISGFLSALTGPWAPWPRGPRGTGYGPDDTVLLVTHGLTMRLACMSLFSWTVAEFEALSNPGNADFRVVTTTPAGWHLDRPFETWT